LDDDERSQKRRARGARGEEGGAKKKSWGGGSIHEKEKRFQLTNIKEPKVSFGEEKGGKKCRKKFPEKSLERKKKGKLYKKKGEEWRGEPRRIKQHCTRYGKKKEGKEIAKNHLYIVKKHWNCGGEGREAKERREREHKSLLSKGKRGEACEERRNQHHAIVKGGQGFETIESVGDLAAEGKGGTQRTSRERSQTASSEKKFERQEGVRKLVKGCVSVAAKKAKDTWPIRKEGKKNSKGEEQGGLQKTSRVREKKKKVLVKVPGRSKGKKSGIVGGDAKRT